MPSDPASPTPAALAGSAAASLAALVDALDRALPQTQCTRCGYPDCRSYAQAVAESRADINQCPPGGAEGVERLARLTGRPGRPIDPAHGTEGPRRLAVIDEDWCIGCTLCLKACPVDSIFGAAKQMHSVIDELCTGCELCIPVCPVDCISLVDATPGRSGWDAWSTPLADEARTRFQFHRLRLEREQQENDDRLARKAALKLADLPAASRIDDVPALDAKRAAIDAAMARARARRSTP